VSSAAERVSGHDATRVAWHRRGVEHAVDTIAWGLMDCDVRMVRIGSPGAEVLTTGFRILTGTDPLHKTDGTIAG